MGIQFIICKCFHMRSAAEWAGNNSAISKICTRRQVQISSRRVFLRNTILVHLKANMCEFTATKGKYTIQALRYTKIVFLRNTRPDEIMDLDFLKRSEFPRERHGGLGR